MNIQWQVINAHILLWLNLMRTDLTLANPALATEGCMELTYSFRSALLT